MTSEAFRSSKAVIFLMSLLVTSIPVIITALAAEEASCDQESALDWSQNQADHLVYPFYYFLTVFTIGGFYGVLVHDSAFGELCPL